MKRFLLAPCSGTICGMRLLFPTILLCAAAHAAEVKVASAPPSAHYDTESVTNAPILRPMMERERHRYPGSLGSARSERKGLESPMTIFPPPDLDRRIPFPWGGRKILQQFCIPSPLPFDAKRHEFNSLSHHEAPFIDHNSPFPSGLSDDGFLSENRSDATIHGARKAPPFRR